MKVLKKEKADVKDELEEKFWKDIISFDSEKGEVKIENYGAADPTVFDTLTLVFKAKTLYAVS